MKNLHLPLLVLLLTWTLFGSPASGWHAEGHDVTARAGVLALPDTVPAFFREAAEAIGHFAIDPDIAKLREVPQLRDRERPEHFLDLELLRGHPLPATRSEFVRLCHTLNVDIQQVGTLPYAVVEWTQLLAVAFAEHRKWPDNPHIRAKCLVYAGWLAHYAADLAMPLHTTIHYDGRVGEDGRSPKSGIHQIVDNLPSWLTIDPGQLLAEVPIEPYDNLFEDVLAELAACHALVDRVYELEPQLPKTMAHQAREAGEAAVVLTPEVHAFALERTTAAARVTARLFLSAWQLSGTINIPAWHRR